MHIYLTIRHKPQILVCPFEKAAQQLFDQCPCSDGSYKQQGVHPISQNLLLQDCSE
uniref:Uncharacterized protein n=1 Tax=Rhizophora mucronata TaxID=61149 RepID=A0A2P2QRF8_RHIMU